MAQDRSDKQATRQKPYVLSATPDWDPTDKLKIARVENPLPRGTLGDLGFAVRADGPKEFPETILALPFELADLAGIEPASIRMFWWDERTRTLVPLWNSGINVEFRFIWAKIRRPGVFVPIGLPRDRVLQEILRVVAHERRHTDGLSPEESQAITRRALTVFLETPENELQQLRQILVQFEVKPGIGPIPDKDIILGGDARLMPFPLPRGVSLEEFKKRLTALETPPGGLPEENLLFTPDPWGGSLPPFPDPDPWPEPLPWPRPRGIPPFPRPFPWPLPWPRPPRWPLCWLFSRNWPTYHHDVQLTGVASGCSGIRSTSVGALTLRYPAVALNGPIISIPCIVDGTIYVGTGNSSAAPGGAGGTLYKIDLATGATVGIPFTFNTAVGSGQGYRGIGGSPAVVGGRVYFSGLDGKVYCVDAATFTQLWVTDLRNPDPAHNQPVQNVSGAWSGAEGWSSPLVVNGKVYVGFGEGELSAFSFIYCLDANTGNVIWLFCTDLFPGVTDNSPNVIPSSAAGISPLPAGFSTMPDPPSRGASPWSSCSYDSALSRIYVGTGNANPDVVLPQPKYASGVLSLDASTGTFQGFFQPAPSTPYRSNDTDIDIPAGPMLFFRGGTKVLAIGSKSGAFFLLDPATMAQLAWRQLLPYDSAGNPFTSIDPHTGPSENMYGVFGTATVHYGLSRLFVGLGGYGGAIDSTTTPFMRALDWNTLGDAWATSGTNPPKYTVPVPPMYTTPGEAGLSSPAVVNDVVFISTTRPALYALDAATGLCLWSAGTLAPGNYSLGPAIYGNYVVVGTSGGNLYVYSL